MKRLKSSQGFNLIEVVLALGITSFAIMSVMGLMVFGVKTNQESEKMTEASNIGSFLTAVRKVSPTNNLSSTFPRFPLPEINQEKANYVQASMKILEGVYLDESGLKVSKEKATYGFLYNISTNDSSNLYLMLYWPAQGSVLTAAGKYEMVTQIAFH
ncbi:MAG: hypothetical protein V4507_15755 [Verrucomicrobiota bacterium]